MVMDDATCNFFFFHENCRGRMVKKFPHFPDYHNTIVFKNMLMNHT